MSDKLLWKNKWLEVYERDEWYTFVHSPKEGVSVLGYRTNGKTSIENYDFLIRKEHTPCHGKGLRLTSLTGTIEEGDTPLKTAKKELLEESGYKAEESEFKYHGWTYLTKFSDFKSYLFSICLDGKEQGEIVGDGTKGEVDADVMWVDIHAASQIQTPGISTIILRMILENAKT